MQVLSCVSCERGKGERKTTNRDRCGRAGHRIRRVSTLPSSRPCRCRAGGSSGTLHRGCRAATQSERPYCLLSLYSHGRVLISSTVGFAGSLGTDAAVTVDTIAAYAIKSMINESLICCVGCCVVVSFFQNKETKTKHKKSQSLNKCKQQRKKKKRKNRKTD